MYNLKIKINKHGMTFITLYKGYGTLAVYERICQNQIEVNNALAHINNLKISYEIELSYI